MGCDRKSIDVHIGIKYYYDPESRNWGFVVPGLHIVGGGETREEAERLAAEAVAFSLEDDEPVIARPDEEVRHVRVTVQME